MNSDQSTSRAFPLAVSTGGGLRPDVAAFLRRSAAPPPPPQEASDAETAAYLKRLRERPPRSGPDQPMSRVTDELVGRTRVPVRIYRPREPKEPAVLVFAHGGGWVSGSLETFDWTCRRLASQIGGTVVSVGYRLAPEHPFPAALDDCYEATRWVAANARRLGGDGRVGIAGSSSGGNLAAAVALLARDDDNLTLACQALIYPVLDAALETESQQRLSEGYGLTRAQMAWFWSRYAPEGIDRYAALCSPGRAPSVERLPPALVFTAEFDPLRDEGEAFAARLRATGIETILRRWPGQIHAFLGYVDQFPDALLAIDQIAADISHLFARSAGEGPAANTSDSAIDQWK